MERRLGTALHFLAMTDVLLYKSVMLIRYVSCIRYRAHYKSVTILRGTVFAPPINSSGESLRSAFHSISLKFWRLRYQLRRRNLILCRLSNAQ